MLMGAPVIARGTAVRERGRAPSPVVRAATGSASDVRACGATPLGPAELGHAPGREIDVGAMIRDAAVPEEATE